MSLQVTAASDSGVRRRSIRAAMAKTSILGWLMVKDKDKTNLSLLVIYFRLIKKLDQAHKCKKVFTKK